MKGNALEKRVISPGSGGVFEPRRDSGDLLPLLGDEGASPSDWMTNPVRTQTQKRRHGHTKRRYWEGKKSGCESCAHMGGRTSVPPVGPKNLETPRSDIESIPKAVTTSPEDATDWSGAMRSSSSSIPLLFDDPSDKSGCGSLEPLACIIASASSSWCMRSLIFAIRRCRCSVAASTKLGYSSINTGRATKERGGDNAPSDLAGRETAYNTTSARSDNRGMGRDATYHLDTEQRNLGATRVGGNEYEGRKGRA